MAAARPAGRRFQKGPEAASVCPLPCLKPSLTDSVSRPAWPSVEAPLVARDRTGPARRNLILRGVTVPASLPRRVPRPNRCAAPVTSQRRAPSQTHRTFGRHGGAAPTQHSAGRVFRLSGDLSLADLGQTGLGFRSRSETVGLQTSWRPELFTATPLTCTAGAYGTTSTVDNESIAREGSSTFFVPYLGVDAERRSQRGRWTASLQFERVGTADEDLSILGRPEPSRKAWVSHWSTAASCRSGSLKEMFATEGTASASTHEASLALHGQYIASPERVTPQFQGVAGGVNPVRGYPESLSAGDTVSLASMQYRVRLNSLFHTANTGRHPTEEAAPDPSGELGSSTHAATPQADREAMRAVDPSTLIPRSSGAPLEVSLRGFLDAAQVRTNQAKSGFGEVANRTLLGVGGGLDLVFRGQFKGLIQADLGFALNGQHQPGNTQVDAGSSRVHVTVMLNW